MADPLVDPSRAGLELRDSGLNFSATWGKATSGRVEAQWVPSAGPAKPAPWTGVPGAFLGILGRVELPEATATWPPSRARGPRNPRSAI